jgi:hypothetical protein
LKLSCHWQCLNWHGNLTLAMCLKHQQCPSNMLLFLSVLLLVLQQQTYYLHLLHLLPPEGWDTGSIS